MIDSFDPQDAKVASCVVFHYNKGRVTSIVTGGVLKLRFDSCVDRSRAVQDCLCRGH
jgi:hypothetical protein